MNRGVPLVTAQTTVLPRYRRGVPSALNLTVACMERGHLPILLLSSIIPAILASLIQAKIVLLLLDSLWLLCLPIGTYMRVCSSNVFLVGHLIALESLAGKSSEYG